MTIYKNKMSKTFFYTDDWVDAQQMAKENPETFEAPTDEELAAIEVGWTVKVSNGRERFWTEVVEKGDGYLLVKVDNMLVYMRGYNLGDILRIEERNIYEIHSRNQLDEQMQKIRMILEESKKNPDNKELAELAGNIKGMLEKIVDVDSDINGREREN